MAKVVLFGQPWQHLPSLVAGLMLVLASRSSFASSEKVLYNFPGGDGGANPNSPLIVTDASLYGTTSSGGNEGGGGTLFALSRSGVATVLHSFGAVVNGVGIGGPSGSLVLDRSGNFFGTTYGGGVKTGCEGGGSCGSVFEVTSQGAEIALFLFGPSYSNPDSGLVADKAGLLYGDTNYAQGAGEGGALFSITKGGKFKFLGYPGPGAASLASDGQGNIYGTAITGGQGFGSVYYYSKSTKSLNELYAFTGGADGQDPHGAMVVDPQGKLYGTTAYGGASGYGTVFKLNITGAKTPIYNFQGGPDGSLPVGNLAIDASGNIFGVTGQGGSTKCNDSGGCGTVFEITASGAKITLHSFTGNALKRADGAYPNAGLTIDKHGHLFGTTLDGGSSGNGTVFEVVP